MIQVIRSSEQIEKFFPCRLGKLDLYIHCFGLAALELYLSLAFGIELDTLQFIGATRVFMAIGEAREIGQE